MADESENQQSNVSIQSRAIDRIDRHFNWVNDRTLNWFPYSGLRPEPDEFVEHRISILFGLTVFLPLSFAGGVVVNWVCSVLLGLPWTPSFYFALLGTVMSFVVSWSFQYVGFHFWNRRAIRLRGQGGKDILRASARMPTVQSTDSYFPFQAPAADGHVMDLNRAPPFSLFVLTELLELVFIEGGLVLLALQPAQFWMTVIPERTGVLASLERNWYWPIGIAAGLLGASLVLMCVRNFRVRIAALAFRVLYGIIHNVAVAIMIAMSLLTLMLDSTLALIFWSGMLTLGLGLMLRCAIQAVRLFRDVIVVEVQTTMEGSGIDAVQK